MMEVGDYLQLRQPAWDWVSHDCCRWVDRWVQESGHPSPIAALGLSYDSERSALLTIKRGGGLVALWTAGMALAGVPFGDDVRPGDVAIIERPTEDRLNQTAAIFGGERWATVSEGVIHFAPAHPLAIWRL